METVSHWRFIEIKPLKRTQLNHPHYSKHGTYRPTLAKQVAENTVQSVREMSREAFKIYESDKKDIGKALRALMKLKGVGPATASLLLSCYDFQNAPFFSDELYRYAHWTGAKSQGWDRKIRYTMKEYHSLSDKVRDLQARLAKEKESQISALDVEKVAYAICKNTQNKPHLDEENDDSCLRPPSPKRRRKDPPPTSPDPIEICRRKGPRGSPTYDELGFELDYEKVAKSIRRPRPLSGKALAGLDADMKNTERKAKVLGVAPEEFSNIAENHLDDRIARDLGLAFHEVGMEEFEEWNRRGFKVDYKDLTNVSQEETDRVYRLMVGSALRKGSKK